MNDTTLSAISLFSGVGMLDEGLRAGLRFMGFAHRTVLHVEREAHGASVLAARMEEGSLDAAPIWSDVCTLDAAAWRGRVDIVVAGFPCQDLSVAGRRVGLDGKRSGLFFEVVRIATDCGAWGMFLENVAGISSATASVMDETEGALDERAAARVVGELADLGWDSEWITLSASDVGASHGRARWFCLAWRVDHTDSTGAKRSRRTEQGVDSGCQELADAARDVGNGISDRESRGGRGVRQAGDELGHARLQHRNLQQRSARTEYPGANDELGYAACDGRNEGQAELPRREGRSDPGGAGLSVADARATGRRFPPRRDQPELGCMEKQSGSGSCQCGRNAVGRPEVVGGLLANASGARLPQRVSRGGAL